MNFVFANLKMPLPSLLFFLSIIALASTQFHNYPGQASSVKLTWLSKPLVGDDDDRVYACSERNLFAFESNGSIAWTLHLAYACNATIAPVLIGKREMYLVAENRVLKIEFPGVATSAPIADVFFGPEKGQLGAGEIIGLAFSMLSSLVFINIKNRGLFAYTTGRQLLWSVGPVLYQFGYRLGCRKGVENCYFTSVPMIDQCEASLYISNSAGELYSLSLRSPHFNWVQDLSSYGKTFTVTPGNNGRLYVTIPNKALVLALGVSMGNLVWQRSIGPLSSSEYTPVVDSNGWISIGSLDGFLYSISPTGDLKKFIKASQLDYVIQVNPFLDCSGYAVYISQTKMEEKVSHIIGENTYFSAMRPDAVVFTLLVPATGAIYWSERYPGYLLSLLSQSDLQHFAVDESFLLAFVTVSKTGNPLPCRSKYQKLLSTCSQTRPKHPSVYIGNKRTITMFLLLETLVLVVLAVLVRFCCIFWRKKKLQHQGLGNFLEKRRSLQLQKKVLDKTITELEQKAAEDVTDELRDLVRERQGIHRKLSTTYSLGRDITGTLSKSLLPVRDGKARSYSFQGTKADRVSLFHTVSNTSSAESNSSSGRSRKSSSNVEEKDLSSPISLKDEQRSSSSTKGFANPLFAEQELQNATQSHDRGTIWLKRRRSLSLTN